MIKQLVLIAAGICLIYASNFQLKKMHQIRIEEKLIPFEANEGDSPEIVIANKMLGGFKGVMILLLWLRAIKLEEEGQYYEIIQLFDLITKLENRIGSVWTYSAWNMSYNISKEIPYPKDKWKWVKAGVNLIKDKGLKYCARDSKLYEQLSFLYYNKVGGITDQYSPFYRQYFAKEMHYMFGGYPDFSEINAAEKDLKKILVNAAANEIYQTYFYNAKVRNDYFKIISTEFEIDDKFEKFQKKYGDSSELKKLVLYYRYKMISDYRLSVPFILKLEKTYGKLDWRSCYTHGLYWVIYSKGIIYSDHISLDRTEMYNLKRMYDYGYIFPFVNKDGSTIFKFGPDLARAKKVHERYLHFMKKYPYNMTTQTFYSAHYFFISNVIRELLIQGRKEDALGYFNIAKPYFTSAAIPDSFDEFVPKMLKISFKDQSLEEQIAFINGSIVRYYVDKFVHGRHRDEQNKLARFIVKNYNDFKANEKSGQFEVPDTIEKAMLLALETYRRGIDEKQLHQKYLDKFDKEIKRLTKIIHDKQ